MTTSLQLLLVLAAMLATTVVRRSVLVREIRFLRPSSRDAKKKRKDSGPGDEGLLDGGLSGAGPTDTGPSDTGPTDGGPSGSDNIGFSWPDSDHGGDSGGGGASD